MPVFTIFVFVEECALLVGINIPGYFTDNEIIDK